MKKLLVAAIIAVSTTGTAYLIYLSLTPGGGGPATVAAAVPEQQILRVAYRPETLALGRDALSSPLWNEFPAAAVPLKLQVTAVPWGKATVPEVSVRAFHNAQRIYFRFEWNDDTENRQIAQNTFPDACAIMFPLNGDPRPESIMMGFLEPANIWAWKAARDAKIWGQPKPRETAYSDYYYPFVKEEVYSVAVDPLPSAVEDLVANRIGTTTPKGDQHIRGRGLWAANHWTVIFERALTLEGSELDAKIPRGAARTVAFAVWNGAKGDRGARKSISDWVRLEVAP